MNSELVYVFGEGEAERRSGDCLSGSEVKPHLLRSIYLCNVSLGLMGDALQLFTLLNTHMQT